ncbi:MAG TPA: DUF2282 domain-containing protein [Gammaproteobacteria bacterium]|jgi:uncharacterized membrane protein|nr:DUF2282 domain-containing protein [Gammaproteobacteria bacterium]
MDKDIKFAIGAAIAATLITASALAADKPTAQEKCYGVSAAGKNDCQTASNSCAGTSEKDRQPDAFVNLPKGLCSKIAGSSLTAGAPAKKKG